MAGERPSLCGYGIVSFSSNQKLHKRLVAATVKFYGFKNILEIKWEGEMDLPNVVDVFSRICASDNGALLWGNPEKWGHAELFAEFNAERKDSG